MQSKRSIVSLKDILGSKSTQIRQKNFLHFPWCNKVLSYKDQTYKVVRLNLFSDCLSLSIVLLYKNIQPYEKIRGGARGVPGGSLLPPNFAWPPKWPPQNFPRDVMPLHWNYLKL